MTTLDDPMEKQAPLLVTGRWRIYIKSGFLTWLIWAFIHVASLPQLQNRMRVETQWLWSYTSPISAARA